MASNGLHSLHGLKVLSRWQQFLMNNTQIFTSNFKRQKNCWPYWPLLASTGLHSLHGLKVLSRWQQFLMNNTQIFTSNFKRQKNCWPYWPLLASTGLQWPLLTSLVSILVQDSNSFQLQAFICMFQCENDLYESKCIKITTTTTTTTTTTECFLKARQKNSDALKNFKPKPLFLKRES